jgi:hypothetical protein
MESENLHFQKMSTENARFPIFCGVSQQRTTTTPQKHARHPHLSFIFNFSVITLMFLYWKQRQAFKKPFSNEYLANKKLVAHPACFRNILQPPITDSLLFASL